MRVRIGRASKRIVSAGLVVVGLMAMQSTLLSASASAATGEGPVWKLTSVAAPTHLSTTGTLLVTATNVGGGATNGSTVTINDVLPPGLVATSVSGLDLYSYFGGTAGLTCATGAVISCTESQPIGGGDTLTASIEVEVQPGAPATVINHATVSGGGAEGSASVDSPVTISSTPAPYGVDPNSLVVAESTRQAGAHPNLTTGFRINTTEGHPVANPKDIRFDLPRGLVGSTVGMPKCQLSKVVGTFEPVGEGGCPVNTIVGLAVVQTTKNLYIDPVYNIVPSPGEPAAFAFSVLVVNIRLDTSVLSEGDYGVRVTASHLTEAEPVISTSITIWGVPADHQGPGPIRLSGFPGYGIDGLETIGGPTKSTPRTPLLTNPTQCAEPLSATLSTDSWNEPGVFSSVSASLPGNTGCGLLPFVASASMLPDTLQAGAPAGYDFDLKVRQSNEPDALATPNVKRVVATLPMGTVISPSAAQGLKSCADEQFGLHSGLPAECPREAQVGTLQITTPSLPEAFSGAVYLATPGCGPCTPEDAQDGKMVRLFVEAQAEGESGIIVKLEGKASINQQTGQIAATFDENPQLPFSDLKLTLGGGSRATLANPRTCGLATTTVDLTPWSSPFTPDFTPSGVFEPTGCYAPPFNPSFVAGTTSIQAGEYTPFTLSFGRTDADQFLSGLQMQMPPGLLGSLAGIPLCREPQAAAGTCGQQSLIGHTQVLTGPGADPFLVSGGQVFLTESYKGAPFGLSIVVPAVAGPYTLSGTTGNGTVVVRAAINIDPHTAALTITADPLPTVLDGIPLQLKVVNVTIDRPGFTFNPTNCSKLAIKAVLTSKESAGVAVSSPFQVTNCAGLGFKPKFTVSTSGKTSRANGASLDAKVIYPLGSKLANIAKVKVDLPKQLPSRLTTLQKACPAAVFAANPGACPAASVVGVARASTPILPVGLTGPVYFVSHAGEEFPNLIVVLQGYGVRFDLIGSTFITQKGVTSSTFRNVPDVPISSFELYLPEGKYSALAANGNLCTSKLVLPTAFVGQNGAELRQSTKVTVTGCPKAKKATKPKAKKAKKAKASRDKRKRGGEATKSARAGHRGGN
jgi:hypothetical protein